MDCKRLEVELLKWNKYEVEEQKTSTYSVEEIKNNKYEIEYCIRYRPVWAIEWILLRWRWNDKGVWTDNGIFNDWNI